MGQLDQFSVVATPNDSRGYAIHLPRPTSAYFLREVAAHALQAPELKTSDSLHLIAVANSGIPIATSILMAREPKAKSNGHDVGDILSIVDPNKLELISNIPSSGQLSIIVDNSVRSVRTLQQVLYKLQANRVRVRYVLRLIDYEDEFEDALVKRLQEAGTELNVLSVFYLSSLIDELKEEDRRQIMKIRGWERH